jgi:hypothetical protein
MKCLAANNSNNTAKPGQQVLTGLSVPRALNTVWGVDPLPALALCMRPRMEAPMSSGAAFLEAAAAAAGAAAGFGALVATRTYGTTGSQSQTSGNWVSDPILRLLAPLHAAATGFFSSPTMGQAGGPLAEMPFD